MAPLHNARFLALVDAAKARVSEVTVADWQARAAENPGLVLVDVREDDEWRAGHVAGAVHIGKGVIERDAESKLSDPDAEIVLYCGGGFRSALAADALQQMGYTNVHSLDGGWRALQDAGVATEAGA